MEQSDEGKRFLFDDGAGMWFAEETDDELLVAGAWFLEEPAAETLAEVEEK